MSTSYKVHDGEHYCIEMDEQSNRFGFSIDQKPGSDGCISTYRNGEEGKTADGVVTSDRLSFDDVVDTAFAMLQVVLYWDPDRLIDMEQRMKRLK